MCIRDRCVVMTSDRGLCGGFNSNIIKKAKSYFSKILNEGKQLKIITAGSKGNDQLKRVYGDKIIENISFKTTLNDSNQNIFEIVFSAFFSSIKRSDSLSLPLFQIEWKSEDISSK